MSFRFPSLIKRLILVAGLVGLLSFAADGNSEKVFPAQYERENSSVEALQSRVKRENPDRFEARVFRHQEREVSYRLFTPKGSKPEDKLPLVIVLHGSSGKGTDNLTQILAGTGALGAGVWALPERQKENPCYVMVPQCPPSEMWTHTASWTSYTHPMARRPTPSLASVMATLDHLLATENIDPTRLYLVGASMGGYGTWDWICFEPKRFAAAIAICGGMPEGQASRLIDLPLWIFHGEADGIVPVEESRKAFHQITELGGKAKYTEYMDGPHNISVYAWVNPQVAQWLFKQKP